MSEFNELLNNLKMNFEHEKNKYYPFIEYIRFPKYKLLKENSKINFDFPITILVGKNGTNKTSILQALYGTPAGKSVGDYWFTTEVDKIDKGGSGKTDEPHCLIYSYYLEKAKRNVEILKTRISKKQNLDYWEPSRPLKKYDMEMLPKDEYTRLGSSSKTRWDVMDKNVVYCDCKEYSSAYDLFFYHHNFQNTKTYRSKQDFIRSRSKLLCKVLENNSDSCNFHGKERIEYNINIDDDVCKAVSEIMGEEYSTIKIVSHGLYTKANVNKPAKTIWIEKNGNAYSEAFAGTGEARVILLVNDLVNAPDKSLLLIDEPEISLHPSAIYKLKNFILKKCLEKKYQIVITTHSVQMVKDFPKEAIKLISKTNNEIEIIENIDFQDAFYELGDEVKDKKMVYVEDRLSKYIIDFIIEKARKPSLCNNIDVRYIPGGAEHIIKNNIVSSSSQELSNCYFLLDGDKKVKYTKDTGFIKQSYMKDYNILADKIPESDEKNMGRIINEMTGITVDIKVSGHKGSCNEQQLIKAQRKFIDFWSNNVKFLPFDTPEIFLKELDDNLIETSINDKNGKEYFENKTKRALNIENVSANDIFEEQKRVVSKINSETDEYNEILNILEALF